MLTEEQIQDYHANGYIGVEEVLSSQELEDLQRVTAEFIEKSRDVTESDNVFDLEPGHSAEMPKLRRLKDPAKQHEIYDQMLRHETILNIVEQLVGPDIRYNGQKLNMKSADFGSAVEWHQDWAFYPHTNDDLLAVGIAIDDMTKENGCLMVIPGSHKGKVYDHHQNGYFVGAVTDPGFDPSPAKLVEVGAGGISIHHVRTLHGSVPNASSKPRRLLLSMYCAVDAWPLIQPVSNWETFNDCILRGEPVLEPRMREAPVRVPLPPAPKSGSIYEIQTMLEKPLLGRKAG